MRVGALQKAVGLSKSRRYVYATLIGYARVFSNDQDTATQVAALKAAKCERIYREQASGGRWDWPELQRLSDQPRQGDVLMVWSARSRPKPGSAV
jgi:DNA invertase Pin-like site-specific DNA recombinase